MKRLLFAVALLCAYASAQTINPNQIRPGTVDGQVLTTVTANQPPSWQQVSHIVLQHNSTNVTDQTLFNALDDGTIAPDSGYTLAKWLTNSTGGWAAEVPSSGGTSNPLTAAASGGAAPGTTFNGSAPVTFDYHSFGAPGISGTPTPGNCANWATSSTLGDAGSACGSGSSGVQYNPSTTAYVFTGSSINEDDNRVTSSAITVSSWTCSGTTCTVTTSAAHGLAAGDWVDVSAMTGWGGGGGAGPQDSGVGTFQVLSAGLTSTQFEVTSAHTGSGSGGNIYSANYWGPYLASKMPYLNGHGTVYWRFAWASDCANPTTFATKYGSITGSPKYFIFNGAQNDLNNGNTATTIEGNLQACWQNAHNAGFIVLQASIVPTTIGGPPASYGVYNAQVNQWLPSQAKTYFNAASGKYFDEYLDLNSYAANMNTISTIQGNSASGGQFFAERVNEAFGAQGGSVNGPPPILNWNLNVNSFDFWAGPNSPPVANWRFLDINQNPILSMGNSPDSVTLLSAFNFNEAPDGISNDPWLVMKAAVPVGLVNGTGIGTDLTFTNIWMGTFLGNAEGFPNAQANDLLTKLSTSGKAWLIGTGTSPTASFEGNHFCVGGSRTCGQPFSTNSFGQLAANNTGGTCAMSAATTCAATISTTYTTPVCIATQQTAASPIAESCSVSGTTVTVTAASSNSSTWGFLVFGNPN